MFLAFEPPWSGSGSGSGSRDLVGDLVGLHHDGTFL